MKREDLILAVVLILSLFYYGTGGVVVPQHGAMVLVVEESSGRMGEVAAVMTDAYWGSLKARGLNYRHYDQDSPDMEKLPKLLGKAKDVGLPALLVTNSGRLLHAGPLPKSVPELDSAVRRATGL